MKAILYICHGTRSKKGVGEAREFLKRVMERIEVPIQEISFLELTEPLIDEGFMRCVDRGASEITVVPIFLLAAGHIKEDIPKALAALQERYPYVQLNVKNPFGVQDEILDAIAELVSDEAGGLTASDSILIVGRGSSDPDLHFSFRQITNGIQKRLNTESVSVCYMAAAEPRFQEGFETALGKTIGRLIVIPYLLFSGLLLNEINQKAKKEQKVIVTGPLTRHRVIEDLVFRKI
jgi:sirohydrochlorin ferrochelatase